MPKDFAVRIAEKISEHLDENPYVVDVPNDGFSDKVACELEKMGYRVERVEFKETRLIIHHGRQR